jgi:uncharacterized protein YkwD
MLRNLCLTAAMCLMLGACATGPTVESGIYHIRPNDTVEIQNRMLDSVNAVRARSGAAPLTLNPQLTAAAQVQARDISRQNRAWPFGSDGSSPYDRIRRQGYSGELVGEIYSQSYETELETLTAWIEDPVWEAQIVSPDATEMGFAWQQDRSGLIWWVVTLGRGTGAGYATDF